MLSGLTGWHFLIILAVVLLIFGATRLPALAKSVGQSARIFKKEMKDMEKDGGKDANGNPIPAAGSTVNSAPADNTVVTSDQSQPKQ